MTSELAEGLQLDRPDGRAGEGYRAPTGPAAAAGLRIGDVILAVDGHEVDDPQSLHLPHRHARRPTRRRRSTIGAAAKAAAQASRSPHCPRIRRARLKELAGANPLAGATVGNLNPAFDDELGLDTDPARRGRCRARARERRRSAWGSSRATCRQPQQSAGRQRRRSLQERLGAAKPPWTIAMRRSDKLLTVTVR